MAVDTLNVVDPEPVTVAGLNVAVVPAGNPVTLKVTVPLNPAPAVNSRRVVCSPACRHSLGCRCSGEREISDGDRATRRRTHCALRCLSGL
jgi:hypothetical protein